MRVRITQPTSALPSARLAARQQARAAPQGREPTRRELGAALDRLDDELVDLRDVLARLRRGSRPGPVNLRGEIMRFDGVAQPAILRSDGPVQLQPATYSDGSPSWSGSSTSSVTIGGTYQGTEAGTLTFSIDERGHPRLVVTDDQGNEIEEIKVKKQDPSGTTYELSNGLTISFSEGDLADGDSFSLDVYPAGSDDGYDDRALGSSVTAGSFTVNGSTITVDPNDTLGDVLDRITASAADVDAVYDPATQEVVLTSRTAGADAVIELTGDTSGLLELLNLAQDEPARGSDGGSDPDTVMASQAVFASVSTGTVTVNGQHVAIDPATQTLADALSAIDGVDGVRARISPVGRVELFGARGQELVITDSSGLLTALGLAGGRHVGRDRGGGRLSTRAAGTVALETLQVRDALGHLMRFRATAGLAGRLRTDLSGGMVDAFRDAGLEDFLAASGLGESATLRPTPARLTRHLRATYADVRDVWLGDGADEGLIEQLRDAIAAGRRDLLSFDVRI